MAPQQPGCACSYHMDTLEVRVLLQLSHYIISLSTGRRVGTVCEICPGTRCCHSKHEHLCCVLGFQGYPADLPTEGEQELALLRGNHTLLTSMGKPRSQAIQEINMSPYKNTSTRKQCCPQSRTVRWLCGNGLSLQFLGYFPHPATGTPLLSGGSYVSPKTLLCRPGWPLAPQC